MITMPGSPDEMKLVSNAMSNATRRKIMSLLKDGSKPKEEIQKITAPAMLDYHLQLLQQAGLVDIKDKLFELTDFGNHFLESKKHTSTGYRKDLSKSKPVDIVEVRQFLPCIADKSEYRIIARLKPPLEGALELLEPLFPRARYSEKLGVLIIQKKNQMITVYSTGNVTMTMVSSIEEAKKILEDLKKDINDAIETGIKSTFGEKIQVDHNEVYKYLPGTNCRICGEQSCYSFAIRLTGNETTLDKCRPLFEQKYAINLEHLQTLMEYL